LTADSRAGAVPAIAGRDAELASLINVLAELRTGQGRAVLVEGEAGIGKSALVARALAGITDCGPRVLAGTCDELTRRFPLLAVRQAVAPGDSPGGFLRGREAEPVQATAPDAGDPVPAALEKLLEVVHGWCAAGPLVLVLENLHWADEATVLWWRRLCRATGQLPLLLVGTRRLVPRVPETDTLSREVRAGGGLVLQLGGLEPGAVRTMTTDLVGGVPGQRLLRWLELARGNPRYVRHLVDEAERSGLRRATGSVTELADRTPGAASGQARSSAWLGPAMASQLDYLTEDASRVLRIASVLGPEFSVNELAAVFEWPLTALLPVLEDSLTAGVLEGTGERLRFRYAPLQQALYDGIAGSVRAALHRQAARTLMQLDTPAEQVARQLMALPETDTGRGWEVSWLAARAEELVMRRPAMAAELFERALRQAGPDDSGRARLEDQLLDALFMLGRDEQTEQLAKHILSRTCDPDRYGHAAWLMGCVLVRVRRYDDACAALSCAGSGVGLSPAWRARFSALRATIARHTGSREQQTRYASEALSAGRQLDDDVAIAYALHAQAVQRFDDGDLSASCRLSDEAMPAVERDPRLGDLRLLMTCNRVSMAAELGRYEEAGKLAREALARGEFAGPRRLHRLRSIGAAIAYELGCWDEAVAELDAGAETDDDDEAEALSIRVLIAGHRDQWPEADRYLGGVRSSTDAYTPSDWDGPSAVATNIAAAALLDIERSRKPEEAAVLLARWLESSRSGRLLPFLQPVLPGLARLCLAAGDETSARAAAEASQESCRQPAPRQRETARWCQGLVRGDADAVLTAAEAFRGWTLPLRAGNAFEDAAVLLARTGNAGRAHTALAEALKLYDQLDASWDARRAVARVRPFGIRPGVRGARRRPSRGWASLTAMEQRVAGLVAAGQSNPDIAAQLFISRRTVESHVSHILAKLQVSSRREVQVPAS
jgi:DNA-binding CsgD family transcriptional regulator